MNELIKVENGVALLDKDTAVKIAEFEKQMKAVKEKEDELKIAILGEMEQKGIIKIETDDMMISYIAPSVRENFDTKSFKAKNPDLYDEYVKISPVKSSIRIKLK